MEGQIIIGVLAGVLAIRVFCSTEGDWFINMLCALVLAGVAFIAVIA